MVKHRQSLVLAGVGITLLVLFLNSSPKGEMKKKVHSKDIPPMQDSQETLPAKRPLNQENEPRDEPDYESSETRRDPICDKVTCVPKSYLDTKLIEQRDKSWVEFLKAGKEKNYKEKRGESETFDLWWYFPPVITCPDRTRIGRITDGGKWVCNMKKMRKNCVVYSLGSAGDFSFEEAVHQRAGCIAHTFDPDPKFKDIADKISTQWLNYHSWGLSSENGVSDGKTYKTIEKTFEELGTTCVDILKIDIEGYEWEVLKGLTSRPMPCVSQIQIEIHIREYSLLALEEFITNLEKHGYYVFNVEPNLIDSKHVQEYSFVKVDEYSE
jgi:FkbM family methyltransferase